MAGDIKYRTIKTVKVFSLVILISLSSPLLIGQNSLIGDGFGGRLWYRPYNFTVGSYSAYSICGDSAQLYAWGDNAYGQLGDGTYNSTSSPVKTTGMSNVHFFSTGYLMGAIKNDNTGWVWGYRIKENPVQVLNNVKFLDAGIDVCTFIKTDGTVWSVGNNSSGCFGNGQAKDSMSLNPQQMSGISTAVRVANCFSSNTILLANGTLMVTGSNYNYELANNLPQNASALTPLRIPGLKNIIDIKANAYNIIALDKFGNVYMWGGSNSNTPQKMNGISNIVAISGCNDGDHFLALDANHNCYGWGTNQYQQMDSLNANYTQPTFITNDVVDILAGETFSYIIKKGGKLFVTGQSLGASVMMNLADDHVKHLTYMDQKTFPMFLCDAYPYVSKILIDRKVSICSGDSFKTGVHVYKTAGDYTDSLIGWNGSDSILTTHLTIKQPSFKNQTITICEGDIFKTGIHTYNASGIYKDTLNSYQGCDSVITTQLTVHPKSTSSKTIWLCDGEYYRIGNYTYSKTGYHNDTFKNYLGCDSVLITLYNVQSKPLADFTFNDHAFNTDDSIQLTNHSQGANSYNWYFGSADSSHSTNPLIYFHQDGFETNSTYCHQ